MTWENLIKTEQSKDYFKKLEKFLETKQNETIIYPKPEDRFNCFKYTKIEDLKVVILGQDPYHGENQAHGLSFSVLCEKLPPSLKNIYQELESDLGIKKSKSGNLTSWAKQGVLLLNTILTVEASKPLSHKGIGWEHFTFEVIKFINTLNQPIVFILWGSHARSYKKYLNNPNHLILEGVHPSPLSSYQGFFGSKPFSKVNSFLKSHGVKEIDWEIK